MRHLHVVVHFGLREGDSRSLGVVHEGVIQLESGNSDYSANFSWLSVLHYYLRLPLTEYQVFFCGDDLFEVGGVVDVEDLRGCDGGSFPKILLLQRQIS